MGFADLFRGRRSQMPADFRVCQTASFSFGVPGRWSELSAADRYQMARNSGQQVEAAFAQTFGSGMPSTITASRFGSATPQDVNEMFDRRVRDDFIKRREKALFGSFVRELPNLRVGGERVLALEFSCPVSPVQPADFMRTEVLVAHRNSGYYIVLESPAADHQRAFGDFDAALRTWTWR